MYMKRVDLLYVNAKLNMVFRGKRKWFLTLSVEVCNLACFIKK